MDEKTQWPRPHVLHYFVRDHWAVRIAVLALVLAFSLAMAFVIQQGASQVALSCAAPAVKLPQRR